MAFLSGLFGKKNEPGLGMDELARRLNLAPDALRAMKAAYTERKIAKQSGGVRILMVPDEPLKIVQRTILRRLLGGLSAHPAAMGFERGQSIATNAAPHVGARLLLKMDIRDFFTATSAARVRDYFRHIGWGGEAADLLVRLTTHKSGLPQGAPTSPRLSNLVNYAMDARLFGLALSQRATYTRYADDMTFSFRFDGGAGTAGQAPKASVAQTPAEGPERERYRIGGTIQWVKEIVKEYGYKLHQDKKLQIRRRHDRMLVTGVVVNEKLNLPRDVRRRLRAVDHRLKTGKAATMTAAQRAGWRAYQQMVEGKR